MNAPANLPVSFDDALSAVQDVLSRCNEDVGRVNETLAAGVAARASRALSGLKQAHDLEVARLQEQIDQATNPEPDGDHA